MLEKKYKILLIAYACEPNKGSEPGVGWNIAIELSKYFDVTVITRTNNKNNIEKEIINKNIKFLYIDLPIIFLYLKKYLGIQIYYIIWQIFTIMKLFKYKLKYDLIYLITLGNLFYINLFPFFFKPFIWGPLGFGYNAPIKYWKYYSKKGKINEIFRIIIKYINRINPILYFTIRNTAKIFAVSPITENYIKKLYKKANVKILSQTGINLKNFELLNKQNSKINDQLKFIKNNDEFIILMTGRLVHWKGFSIGILAFYKFIQKVNNTKLLIIGNGPELSYLNKLINRLRISEYVILYPEVAYETYIEILKLSDLFIYPSLHEPGSFVLLEAICAKKNIICFRYGEPDTIVVDNMGIKIQVGESIDQFATSIYIIYEKLKHNTNIYSYNFDIYKLYSWENKVLFIKKEIEEAINENTPGS